MKKINALWVAFLAVCFLVGTTAQAHRITVTLVGNGYSGYNGDGLSGPKTLVGGINDVCTDASGNIYFTDISNNRVRMLSARTGLVSSLATLPSPQYMCIDPTGTYLYVTASERVYRIATATGDTLHVAGCYTYGYSGDGGAATAAKMTTPEGICMDAAGNLYVADYGNNAIREIAAGTGIITTVAGTGASGYTGDGGAATAATLKNPVAICVDQNGNLYFSDQVGIVVSYIREVNASTGIITTIAGTGGGASGDGGPATAAGLGGIWGMCCDTAGNLFLCDVSCSCREIAKSTGIINTVAGSLYADGYSGDGADALVEDLNWPYGVYSDPTHNLFVADHNNYRLRKAIELTHTPVFAMGHAQWEYPCPGVALPVTGLLEVADLDSAQAETWSVLTPPANGSVSGFPYTALSHGADSVVTPVGLTYTSTAGYLGLDSFQVLVSDGTYSDTVMVYMKVQNPTAATITGVTPICVGAEASLSASIAGGTFALSNGNAALGTSSVLTGMAAGVDTVTYTVMESCLVTTTAVITVKPVPSAGTIAGVDSICAGTTVTLSESVTGGEWFSLSTSVATVSSSTGIVNALTTGSTVIDYTVTSGGCTGYAELPLYVNTAGGSIVGASTVCPESEILIGESTPGGTWSVSNSHAAVVPIGTDSAGIVGLSSGVDTVYYLSTSVCGTGTSTLVVTVNPMGDPGTVTVPSHICETSAGVGIGLTVAGGSLSVSNGNALLSGSELTPVAAGMDTVYYTITGSCGVTDTASAVFTVDAPPTAGIITGTGLVYDGSTVTLMESVTGGVWSATNTGITIVSADGTVHAVAPGTDSIVYTVSNSCGSATTTFEFTVLPVTTGIGNHIGAAGNAFAITPNPFAGAAQLVVTSNIDAQVTYTVTDAAGRQVAVFYGTTNAATSMPDIAVPGTYFVRATGAGFDMTRTVVKE
jgi:sugar lactone lactonase YvrE